MPLSQELEQCGGNSGYKDQGIRWLLLGIIDTLAKDNEDNEDEIINFKK